MPPLILLRFDKSPFQEEIIISLRRFVRHFHRPSILLSWPIFTGVKVPIFFFRHARILVMQGWTLVVSPSFKIKR